MNLSDTPLSLNELAVLNKGLKFCISNNNVKKSLPRYSEEIERFIRTLQIKYFFLEKAETEIIKFTGNPDWSPPAHMCSSVITGYGLFLLKSIKKLLKKNKVKNNISMKEREALKTLRKNKNIIIQKADKGGCITVINAIEYKTKIETMLADTMTYTQVDNINLPQALQEVNEIFEMLQDSGYITEKQKNHLQKCSAKIPLFYALPKVHKTNIPYRPIVSQISSPAYNLNKYLDYILTTSEKTIPNLLQDTTKFLQNIKEIEKVDTETLLFTIDVTSLYTVLPHEMVINYVKEMYVETLDNWDNHTPDIRPISVGSLELIIKTILKQTFFSFNSKNYTQNFGITMGAPSSVKLANITLYKHLQKISTNFLGTTPYIQLRLIDDIFGLFKGSEAELREWLNHLNNSHNNIKFTMELSKTEIPFLDTTVYLENNILKTRLYKKPTDNKQYLHFHSEHPKHVKSAIPYAQALRYRRIIVDDQILDSELKNLLDNFISRAYPINIVTKAIDRAKGLKREDLLRYKNKNSNPWKATPCVLTFCNALIPRTGINIQKILSNSWEDVLKLDETLAKLDTPKIVFKNCTTITSLVISASYPPKHWSTRNNHSNSHRSPIHYPTPNNNHKACLPCKKPKCLTCPIIQSTNSFISTTFSELHKIKQDANCASSDIIYLVTCKKCRIQYVGETGQTLRGRFNNHRSCIKLKKDTPLSIHFNSQGHDITHLQVITIEQLSQKLKSDRLAKETFWQLLLGTIYPKGLNQFPIKEKEKFNNLTITSPTDLIIFQNLICSSQEQTLLSRNFHYP